MKFDLAHISPSLSHLDTWIEQEGFKGWGSHDALNSPLLKRLTFGNRLLGIVWVQLFKRSPINLRPIFGVAKEYNPKGMGLFLGSYLRKYGMSGNERDLEQVNFFADWLQENISPGYSGACWGYNFDWPNRGFFAPAGIPTIVNTAFIGLAFLDVRPAFERLSQSQSQPVTSVPAMGDEWLKTARSACDFLLRDLNRLQPTEEELCFSYTPLDQRYIHNANLLGAQLLAAVYAHTGEAELAHYALAAARYTARRQQQDGSWLYGEGNREGWVDNFHTGFVLVALKQIAAKLSTDEFDETMALGYRFWKEGMFLPDGTPKYYPNNLYPIDSHSIAQAILTFLSFADQDSEAYDWAYRVARWGIKNMQDRKGYFHYQIYRRYRIRIPYMRWSQAWMQRALTEILWTMDEI